MNQKCDYCINKTQCAECDKQCRDKFIPSDEVKKYFKRYYVGVHGVDGHAYHFDNLSENLVPTHIMWIGNTPYCPYCGHKMLAIQDDMVHHFRVIGYTCICQGARNEIEYEAKLKELKEKHEQEISELNREYNNKLVFCTDKLLEIKHAEEKRSLEFFGTKHGHMSTLNGEKYTDIEQIVR